ncbi:MAG: preprotein translocase subunit SecG [Pseudomonadota bacterium]|nr:MAG: preprotein translocase subunit SecG [Pseudomonadota bacterium]
MIEVILVIDILVAIAVVALVLLQQGKGADMGAAFGAGASATLFGSRGSSNFLTRATAILATIFFLANIALAYFAAQQSGPKAPAVPAAIEQAPAPVPAVPPVSEPPAVPAVPK